MIDINTFSFSKSSMNLLTNCPKSFKLSYVDGIKGKPNKSMIKGSKIHAILDNLNKNQVCLDSVPPSYKMHIINYINFLKDNKLNLPTYSEQKLHCEFEGLKFNGIVDACFVEGDRAIVIDYKTGKESYSLADYRFELQLYALLIEKTYNLNVIKYGIFFTGRGVFLPEINSKKYEDVIIKINETKKILAEKSFQAQIKYQTCQRCMFNSFCDEYKHIYP